MKLIAILTAFLLTAHLFSQNNPYFEVTWAEQNSGVNTRLNCITGTDNINYAFACGENGTVIRTTNGGLNWITSANGIPANINLNTISMIDAGRIITAGNTASTTYVYRSDDNGQSWSMVFTQESGRINSVSANSGFVFISGNSVGERWSLWKSTDLGAAWDSSGMYLPQQGNESGLDNSLRVQRNNTTGSFDIWMGTNNNKIYYSPDAGRNWSQQLMPEENIYSISSIGREIICGGNNLYSSSNNGSIWQPEISLGAGNINGIILTGIVMIIPMHNLTRTPILYIRSDNKIYWSDNGGGADWEVKYSATEGNYTQISNSHNSVWAVRDNGGITHGRIDGITGFVPNTYPYSFELKQNYPNPFNPKTTIPIFLYRSTNISLKIYNSSGELVTTLLDGQKDFLLYDNIPYGYSYSVEWDASAYSSGVYYYQVISDDYKETRKMMLVK